MRLAAELQPSTQTILELRPDLLSTVLTMQFERFPTLTSKEIMVIAGIPTDQLLHTRAAQDLLDRGRKEGEAKLTLRQLNRRCGPLREAISSGIILNWLQEECTLFLGLSVIDWLSTSESSASNQASQP